MEAIVNRRSIFKFLTVAAVAAPAIVAPALVTSAAAEVDVYLNFAAPPPPPRYEPLPVPRPGYVWAPGVWVWSENRHVWRTGYWVPARPGHRYVAERWEPYWEGGRQRWRYLPSRWDRDGDGVANRYDRYEYNPHRW